MRGDDHSGREICVRHKILFLDAEGRYAFDRGLYWVHAETRQRAVAIRSEITRLVSGAGSIGAGAKRRRRGSANPANALKMADPKQPRN